MSQKNHQSIYTKIFHEKLEPIIFHDEDWFVILANRPINEGHLLVVPKEKSLRFYEISNVGRGFEIATQCAKILQKIYDPPRVSLFVKGFTIEQHAHIHVMPLYKREDMEVHVDDMKNIDTEEMKKVAAKIKSVIKKQPIK